MYEEGWRFQVEADNSTRAHGHGRGVEVVPEGFRLGEGPHFTCPVILFFETLHC